MDAAGTKVALEASRMQERIQELETKVNALEKHLGLQPKRKRNES